jgi:hypothetical protein
VADYKNWEKETKAMSFKNELQYRQHSISISTFMTFTFDFNPGPGHELDIHNSNVVESLELQCHLPYLLKITICIHLMCMTFIYHLYSLCILLLPNQYVYYAFIHHVHIDYAFFHICILTMHYAFFHDMHIDSALCILPQYAY